MIYAQCSAFSLSLTQQSFRIATLQLRADKHKSRKWQLMQTTQLNSMRPTQNTQLTQLNNATLLQHISQIPTSLDVFVSLAQVHCSAVTFPFLQNTWNHYGKSSQKTLLWQFDCLGFVLRFLDLVWYDLTRPNSNWHLEQYNFLNDTSKYKDPHAFTVKS